ncbi:MAG: DUF3124 domain-containing protein [Proteobacteria bacterium]|nr:DUF3124 domain-containing protein [Pseudomonadota bacterium]
MEIEQTIKRGGPGAKFIVRWQSDHEVNQPIIRGIMLSTRAQQGISFICPGRENNIGA